MAQKKAAPKKRAHEDDSKLAQYSPEEQQRRIAQREFYMPRPGGTGTRRDGGTLV